MTQLVESKPDRIRAMFEARNAEWLTMSQVYGALDLSDPEERRATRSYIKDMVKAGFLWKEGARSTAVFRFSGRGMRRRAFTAEQRQQRREETAAKKRLQRATARQAMAASRGARVERMAGTMPGQILTAEGKPGETVEQFLRRGGRVQRLPAHWEQMERAA